MLVADPKTLNLIHATGDLIPGLAETDRYQSSWAIDDVAQLHVGGDP